MSKIRLAKEADLEAAFGVMQAANVHWQMPAPWTKAQLLEEIEHEDAQVWLWNAPAKAFLAARRIFEECWVMEVATHPQFFRQGAAKALLQETQSWAETLQLPLWLEVRVTNEAAIGLYKSCGFTEQGRRKKYYPPAMPGGAREDALQMCWRCAS